MTEEENNLKGLGTRHMGTLHDLKKVVKKYCGEEILRSAQPCR